MPYIHFTEDQKLRANSVDLVEFLRRQGEKLISSGQDKRLTSDHSKPETAKRRNGSVPLLRIFLAACLSAEIFCPLLLIGWPGCLLSTVRALLRQFRRLKQIVAMVTCANQSNHLIPIYYSRQSEN